jgi:hypothetical protein
LASKARSVTCKECYFHQSNLCALNLLSPCPTFRPAVGGAMVAPKQATLIPQPLRELPRVAIGVV